MKWIGFLLVAGLSVALLTLQPASAAPSHVNLVGFVFYDADGNRFFQNGIDMPVEGARLTLVTPDGRRQQVVTNPMGFAYFTSLFDPSADEVVVEVEYPARYRELILVPSPNDNTRKVVVGRLGNAFVVFRATRYQPVAD